MSQAQLDFASDNAHTGFRLALFEWFNWGTFDKAIFSIDLKRENALLTGDIGSGKSTIVDAITTLLVPHHRIVYNKAAGAQGKERTLYSYIVGEYKSIRDENFGTAKAAALRDPSKTFSVLLACFENEGFGEVISLAQFFWIGSGNHVHKFYLCSRSKLSIERDFLGFDDIRKLKKRLRSLPHTSIYDQFRDYSKEFRRAMGIRNEQALNLFYQTVSLKAIGNLTDFIRKHMLEPSNIDEKIDNLTQNFYELGRAHDLILQAKREIEMLTPIDETAKKYASDSKERKHFETMRETLEAWAAKQRIALLEKQLYSLRIEMQKSASKKRALKKEAERLSDEIANIKIQLRINGADRLNDLSEEISRLSETMEKRKESKRRYDELCKSLALHTVKAEHGFFANKEEAKGLINEVEERTRKLQEEMSSNTYLLRKWQEERDEIEHEIEYLRQRRSNIPQHVAKIRDAIAKELGVEADDLPFVGELIRVKHKEWEGAIERVLHGFALSLIVDSNYYESVSDYVEHKHLGGRLVYLKFDNDKKSAIFDPFAPDSLLGKIEVKSDSIYADRLWYMLKERFDIPCVQSLEDFRRRKRAVTIHGQIKSSLTRHEKDDRFKLMDRARWVLGWSNREKLALLEDRLSSIKEKEAFLAKKNQEIQESLDEAVRRRDKLRDLLNFDSFDLINWYSLAKRIEELQKQKLQIEESSDILQTLQSQLQNLEIEHKEITEKRDEIERRLGALEEKIRRYEEDKQRAERTVAASQTLAALEDEITSFIASIDPSEWTLKSFGAQESKIRSALNSEIGRLDKRIMRAREKILSQMKEYIHAFPVISKEFDASVESVEMFQKRLVELKRDNLPRWRKRFKLLLKEKMVQDIIVLQNALERQSSEIVEKIARINDSLREIEYDEGSYIELISEPTRNSEIREFKESLKNAVSGAIGEDNRYDEQKFLQIKALIERFNGREGHSDEDRKWRRTVTDVRQWFEFSAAEKYIADGSQKEYFTDSGGKSGGQKEKLAYTVLASSLAFQFGLEHDRIKSRSFRFVMIDEAFGRGSDESARYGLRLFEKLNLQLLVITPKQKIHVIEPYVKTVHLVHNKDGRDSSVVSMSIEEFQKRQERQ